MLAGLVILGNIPESYSISGLIAAAQDGLFGVAPIAAEFVPAAR